MPVPASELISRLQMETDRAPDNSPEWRKRLLYFLSKAQERVVRDAPFLSREQEVRVIMDPDVASVSATDVLQTTSDPWVLKVALTSPAATGTRAIWELESPERHSGKILRVQSPADQPSIGYERTREFIVREVWAVSIGGGVSEIHVSLDKPWQGPAATDLEYRMFTKAAVLPPELGQVLSVKIHDHPYGPLDAMPAGEYDNWNYARYSLDNTVLGVPRVYSRGQTTYLQAPNVAPTVAKTEGPAWIGPEPKGKFAYAISLVFGKQEMWLHSGNPSAQSLLTPNTSRVQPWNESAVGPSSDTVDNSGAGADSIALTFPNYDFSEGFAHVGSLREGRSGFKVRIWRARYSSATPLDFDSRFYLLSEVAGDAGTYNDNGSETPDRNRPAPGYSGVQQTLQFFPSGDARYELVVRGAMTLAPLQSETQIPNVDAMAVDLLVHLAKGYMYEAAANTAYALSAFRDYTAALESVMNRTASVVPPNTVVRIGWGKSSGGVRRLYPQYPEEPTEIS